MNDSKKTFLDNCLNDIPCEKKSFDQFMIPEEDKKKQIELAFAISQNSIFDKIYGRIYSFPETGGTK